MCGFVVLYQPDNADFDMKSLARMTHSLDYRGPDDFGFCAATAQGLECWKDHPPQAALLPGVAMGHRRLSILDLSEAGRQPFLSADARYALVYNGEVYNYRELRTELESLGWQFRTKTDTEVILCAYAQWGTDCFQRFNGMWALVIWDSKERTLVASRDRFGVKPLYLQKLGKGYIFASEAKAILAHSAATRGVNRAALVSYLMDLGAPQNGATFYEGIHAVEPGSFIEVRPRGSTVRRYWNLPEAPHHRFKTLDEAAAVLEQLLRDSVALRMRSDVRIGTMLSGGLDSTSVISMVRQLMDASGGAREVVGDALQAFTAIYSGTEIDEEAFVNELCASLEIKANKVFPLQERSVEELFFTAVWHMERPYFNSVPLVHTLLMRKARSIGVKVVLNGHGPDEMLAGYPAKYIPEAIGDALTQLRWGEAAREITAMRDIYGLGRRRALHKAVQTRTPRWLQYRALRASAEKSDLLRKEARHVIARQATPPSRHTGAGGLHQALCEDFFVQSLPNWLHLEDRISMSESIEARLPFLDYRIVELAFSLPNQFKIDGGVTKRVLRHAMKSHLPDPIVSSLRKVPFSGPDKAWIQGPLRPWIERTFLRSDAQLFEYFDPVTTRPLLKDFLDSPKPRTSPYRIWKLLSTEVWLQSMSARHARAA